jgi:hypothetical protein
MQIPAGIYEHNKTEFAFLRNLIHFPFLFRIFQE